MWFIMKVKVYVNYDYREVMSEKEYEKRVNRFLDDYFNDNDSFAEWLEESYNPYEVWGFDEAKREAVREEYGKQCRVWAENEVRDTWAEEEIEI